MFARYEGKDDAGRPDTLPGKCFSVLRTTVTARPDVRRMRHQLRRPLTRMKDLHMNVSLPDTRSPVGIPHWAAIARYGNRPAPGGLALVHDFLDTRSAGEHVPDLLSNAVQAQGWGAAAVLAWSTARRTDAATPALTEYDAAELRELRDAIDTLVAGVPAAVALRSLPTPEMTLRGSGEEICWMPSDGGWQWFSGTILAEVMLSQHAGTWPRLKRCRNTACHATFYDSSWNNAGSFHNAGTCGPLPRRLR
jgi:predicted RNA-binding Zn ribbon-like protein